MLIIWFPSGYFIVKIIIMATKLTTKKLVLGLIKSDLINHKLLCGLDELGLNTLNYHLYLSELIFELMDFRYNQQNEKNFVYYLKRLKKVKHIDIKDNYKSLENLALDIYKKLKLRKT
jgi:hypothetical protein